MYEAHGYLPVGGALAYTSGGGTGITTSVRIDVRKVVAVVAKPYDPVGADTVTKYYSTLPYMTQLTDAPALQRFESVLDKPYKFVAELFSGDRIGARSIPSLGDAELMNTDDSLDDLQELYWAGRDWDVYVGDEGAPWADFELVWPGKASAAKYTRDRVIVPLEDVGKRFDQPAQSTLYKWESGTANSLIFDGSDNVNFGDVLDRGTNSVTLAVAFVTSTAQNAVLVGKGLVLNGSGGTGYMIGVRGSGTPIYAECGDGTSQLRAFGASDYDDGAVHWAAVVVDKGADLVRAYYDGTELDTTDITGLGSLDNGDSLKFGENNATGNRFTGRILKVYMDSTALTVSEVAAIMDDPDFNGYVFPAGELGAWPIDEGTGTSVGDIVGSNDGTINGAVWYGQRNGGADVQGKPVPMAYGPCDKVKPTMLDPIKRVFQFNDGGTNDLLGEWDQGSSLGGTDTDQASEETFWTGAGPTAPDVWTHLAKGLIRLGAAPVGELTLQIQGSTVGGYTDQPHTIQRSIAANRAGISDPSGFDTASYTALGSDQPGVGLYVGSDERPTLAQLFDRLMSSFHAYWTIARTGVMSVGKLVAPGTPSATVTRDNIVAGTLERIEAPPVHWRDRIGHAVNFTVQDANAMGSGVSLKDRADFSRESLYVEEEDTTLQTAHLDAIDETRDTLIYTRADASAELAETRTLYGERREIWRVQLATGVLQYWLGDVVEFQLDPDRYNLTGRNFLVIGIEETVYQGVTLTLWG
jgi:hypothetical protein